jgi:hypothetical protein
MIRWLVPVAALAGAWLLVPAPLSLEVRQGQVYRASIAGVGRASIAGQTKTLDVWDRDFTREFRATRSGAPPIELPPGATLDLQPVADHVLPASDWRAAETFRAGETIAAYADERPYLPSTEAELRAGVHWYKVRLAETEKRLVFFNVEVDDRDVPSDVDLFTATASGELTPYREGSHRYTPEATQNFPGLASYRTRVLEPGRDYLVRVAANHPWYRLRTKSYPVPPYADPKQAVEVGMDLMVSLGDAWLNNVPRRGAVAQRDTMQHAEVQNCVACHATQFTMRAYRGARDRGFAPVNPHAAANLQAQLANNPRPLPGHEGANWSRVIFSARAVSTRLPLLVDSPDVRRGAVKFLDLVNPLEPEADGAPPNVSPMEVAFGALRLYREQQHPRAAELERQVRAFAASNVTDLSWKVLALRDAADIERLRTMRGEADFIESLRLYALAAAGTQPDLSALLASQQPWGGWQGDPGPKTFNTPFRDTQFALLALAERYPQAVAPAVVAEPEPALAGKAKLRREAVRLRRAADTTALLSAPRWVMLRALNKQFRQLAGDDALLAATKTALNDGSPLERLDAAIALTHWYTWRNDESILDALAARLSRETEPRVRRVLTEGVSNILDENLGYAEAWMRAMVREQDRAKTVAALHERSRRQGVVLARHLSTGTRDAKLSLLTSLWDLPLRHMAIPEDAAHRSEVTLPAYYEEFSRGVPRLHEPEARYAPYGEALRFRYGAGNGFFKTRVGNDSDAIDLTGAGPELEAAILACVQSGDAELQTAAIKAGSALGGAMSPAFTRTMLALADTSDVRYVYENSARGRLTLGDPAQPDEATINALLKTENLAVALPLVAAIPPGSVITRDARLIAWMESLLQKPPAGLVDRVIAAAAVFPRVADGPLMRSVVLEALGSGDRATEAAAIEVVVRNYFADPTMPTLAEQFGAATQGRVRQQLLDSLDPSRFSLRLSALSLYNPGNLNFIPADANLFSSNKVQEFVARSLTAPEPQVRAAAQDLVRTYPQLAKQIGATAGVRPLPDPQYFEQHVQPILSRAGQDGKACVMCHATHARFTLRLNAAANYKAALNVIDLANPKQSLILIKPTRPNDSAGDPNFFLATHNGGERWKGNESSVEYQTILAWIRGAKAAPVTTADR